MTMVFTEKSVKALILMPITWVGYAERWLGVLKNKQLVNCVFLEVCQLWN